MCGILYVLKYAHREPAAGAADPLSEKRRARAGGTGRLRRRCPDDLRLTPLAPSYARRPGPVPNPMRKDPFTMIKIAPSILSADFANLGRDIQRIDSADYVHVDVMDGLFVPNISIGIPVVKSIRPVTKLPLDVHLMIVQPEKFIPEVKALGAYMMNVHYEACPHLHRVIGQIHEAGMKAGVTLNPATPIELLRDIINDVDMVLLMSVNPGFGGQKFIPSTIGKVERLRRLIQETGSNALIEIDGGVNLETGRLLAKAGADVLVAGSYIFGAPNPQEACSLLSAL